MSYGGTRDQDTICAVSTPSGFGGVAVIRVSGSRAFQVAKKVAPFLPEKPESHKIYFGTIISAKTQEPIDEALVSTFHSGRSYTNEETVEISCHGSPAITQWLLQELVVSGARPADRGEFSYRAFINGKIDLTQAEGVLQLVESQSKQSAQQGLRQLKGGLSKQLKKIQTDILFVLASIEAAIDFSTEDIDVLNVKTLLEKTSSASKQMEQLVSSYDQGRLLVDGLKVALSGAPNVGKSSLFNLLLEEDRSIVTNLPGTTRDVVEAQLLLKGIKVAFLDTAGIRKSDDVIEQMGIQKSRDSQQQADVIFFLFDACVGLSAEDVRILRSLEARKLVLIGNKLDQATENQDLLRQKLQKTALEGKIFNNQQELQSFMQQRVFFISTLEHKFRGVVIEALEQFLVQEKLQDEAIISHARHFDNISRALEMTKKAGEALSKNTEPEFVALDLKTALICLQETLGERFDDQIMDFVFKQFCIGK